MKTTKILGVENRTEFKEEKKKKKGNKDNSSNIFKNYDVDIMTSHHFFLN